MGTSNITEVCGRWMFVEIKHVHILHCAVQFCELESQEALVIVYCAQ